MNKGLMKKLLPHFIAVIVFVIVAVIYCKPVLQGEVLQQSDIVQWEAMARNSFEYKEKHGHFPLWTNGMFSGMPAYQIAMEPDVAVNPSFFYGVFSLFLPKPVSFFVLACICFYLLTQILRINPYIGIVGSLAYAYCTYHPVIIATGHDTKMFTLGLLPGLIASLILLFEKRYLWGAALTALFTALMVGLIHMQIVYYTLIIAVFMVIGYAVYWYRKKDMKHFLIAASLAVAAGAIGTLSNAVQILTTLESSKTTIRGGTELPDANSTETGLSKSYAFSYSMGIAEPLVMLVPKMFGGSDYLEMDPEESKAVEQLRQMPQELAQQMQYNLRFYWGGIGGTSGPPYVGAIICFLAFIGFFLLDNKHKWWILSASVLAIVMSWGGYFDSFNSILLKYLPMYNKFRAPSMTIVIPTFLFCMMAVMTLQKIYSAPDKKELWDQYKKGLYLSGGIFLLVILIYFNADFTSESDQILFDRIASYPAEVQSQIMGYARSFINALKEDRQDLFMGSLIRSFFFVVAAAFLLWLSIRKKMQSWIAMSIIGVLAFIDVMGINVKYLNEEKYQDEIMYENNFMPTAVDQQILQDTGFYRVLDLRQGIRPAFNGGALTMYHHHSVGGYHPAKLSIYQDLIEHQLYNFPQSLPSYNMLNTKYIIQQDQEGREVVIPNPDALGPVWFVSEVKFESTPQAVMNALSSFRPRDTAIVFASDQQLVSHTPGFDSAASIRLIENDNDVVTYQSSSSTNRFAVFSEVYYEKGWKAYIDEKEVPIIRTNYVLRGLSVPAGQHHIRFEFRPSSFYTGEKIALIAGIVVYLLLLGAIVQTYRNGRKSGS